MARLLPWVWPRLEPNLAERIVSAIPKGRIAEPGEIVGAVLFPASDASGFITGQTIYVDGGFLAG